jgi:hypothetical protein
MRVRPTASGRDVPSRPLAALLSNISIWEPRESGEDFFVHLAGSATQIRFGEDITGKMMSAVFDPFSFDLWRDGFNAVLARNAPVIADVVYLRGVLKLLHLEAIGLPVLSADQSARWVLLGMFYFR